MPCMAISCHTSCSNHGIIGFPYVKLTILGGQNCFTVAKMSPTRRSNSLFWTLPDLKIEHVVPLLTHNNVAIYTISGNERPKSGSYVFHCLASLLLSTDVAHKGLILGFLMPCIVISCHKFCSKHGIIGFPIVKLTILGCLHCFSLQLTRVEPCLAVPYWALNPTLWAPSSLILV